MKVLTFLHYGNEMSQCKTIFVLKISLFQ